MSPTIITDSRGLERSLRRLGLAILMCYLTLTPLSYAIAAVSPFNSRQSREIEALTTFVNVDWLPAAISAWLTPIMAGHSWFADREVRVAAYMLLFVPASVAAVRASWLLVRWRAFVTGSTVQLIRRMAVAFGLVSVVTYPMATQDLWLSVVWGRMIAQGHNPYYEFFTPAALGGTPLLDSDIQMTWGPVWAWQAAAAAFVAGSSVTALFLTAKLLLLAWWLVALWALGRLLVDRPFLHQAGALCFFGWWPMSVGFTVSEGHNDVAMIAMVLLWLIVAAGRTQAWSLGPLMASVFVKYASAPLVAVELLRAARANRETWGRYVVAASCSVLLVIIVALPLWHSTDVFAEVARQQGSSKWEFLTPVHAAGVILRRVGLGSLEVVLSWVARVLFAGVVLYNCLHYWRRPSPEALANIALSWMCALLFAFTSHVWPWYIMWLVPLAAYRGEGVLWRFSMVTAFAAPFLNLMWLGAKDWSALSLTSVAFFGCVFLLFLLPGWRQLEWVSESELAVPHQQRANRGSPVVVSTVATPGRGARQRT